MSGKNLNSKVPLATCSLLVTYKNQNRCLRSISETRGKDTKPSRKQVLKQTELRVDYTAAHKDGRKG